MSYLVSGNKNECTGCRACAEICGVKAISMIQDLEGFFYPKINTDSCIKCNMCKSVCPYGNSTLTFRKPYKAYVAQHLKRDVLINSSSGGAFMAIVKTAFNANQKSAIYGVMFKDKLNVETSVAYSVNEATSFQKSKYVQSNTAGCYKKVKADLLNDYQVVFFGVPCQIAALRCFLNKEYNNLICVDIVCHGVPSQSMFDKYIGELESRYSGIVDSYYFRNKHNRTRTMTDSTALIKFNDGSSIVLDSIDDPFLRAYHSRCIYRPSCYNCEYARTERIGDFTICDAYGVEDIFSDLDTRTGVSLVLVNNEKGKFVLQKLKDQMDIREVDLEIIKDRNESLNNATQLTKERELIMKALENGMTFSEAVDKALPISKATRILKKFITPIQIEKIKKKIVILRNLS